MPRRGFVAATRSRWPRTSGNLAGEAYRRIKALILTLRALPGDQLLHRVLVDRLRMSSTPVREAMGRLIQDGYIRHVPNVGYFVREMGPEEAEQLYEAREVLETWMAAQAAGRMRPQDVRVVERACLAYRRAIGRRPRKARVILDMRFHQAIARLTGNPYLVQALEGLLYRIAATRNVEAISPEQGGLQADLAHRRILEALRRKDPERAQEAMREHIRRSRAFIVGELEARSLARAAGGGRRR